MNLFGLFSNTNVSNTNVVVNVVVILSELLAVVLISRQLILVGEEA